MAKVLDSTPETRQSALVTQGVECLCWTPQPDQRCPACICGRAAAFLLLLRCQVNVQAKFFFEVGIATTRADGVQKAADQLAERRHGWTPSNRDRSERCA